MIKEVIIEPTPVYVGNKFKIKIKSEVTWNELKNKTFSDVADLTFDEIKRGA